MRVSQFFIATQKEAPSEAELISHKLMLRAGLIKRLASGLYSWMPLGLRVLRKIETIVRTEMNRAGAVELLMPAVQPAELWEESGRWQKYGPELLRLKDRHQRDFCFGPTHEEVITDIVRREVRSYRQLPLNFYQIQTKFRDEIRPRFGVMRAREFLMKDAYSFHVDEISLQETYKLMYQTYTNIFEKLGLKFRAVAADTGSIGGTGSHEFHVLADSGEDAIAFCPSSDYAANIELAEAIAPSISRAQPTKQMQKVATPGKHSIQDVSDFLKINPATTVKSLFVIAGENKYLVLLRGDHALNEIKLAKILDEPFHFANDAEFRTHMKCSPGSLGPVGVNITVVADRSVAVMSDFVCGANEEDHHLLNVNFGRDLPEPKKIADIRNVVTGDPSPDGKGKLEICRGIEVGHIFQLRKKYSEAMQVTFQDKDGNATIMEMGCYGIGVSRIIGAAIEQNNDDRGIIFPTAIAPFELAIVPIGMQKSEQVKQTVEKIYLELDNAGIEVLLDDRDERPGVMFADMELIGIPHRIVIGERGLKQGEIEYQARNETKAQTIPLQDAISFLKSKICAK